MADQQNNNKQNRSMFLYTALIFAVALIFIILAFFGQTNISNLRRSTEQANAPTATEQTENTDTPIDQPDALAQLGNAVSALEAENSSLKKELAVYAALVRANAYISANDPEKAQAELDKTDFDTLDSEQKTLYEQTSKKINKLQREEE